MAFDFNDLIQTRPVTDTNAASRTQASLAGGAKSLADSYTTFLSLLTTQLENQDPLSPLDSNAFTQQLVQMTGVQQQLLSNELLQQLVNAKDDSGYDAVALIGKNATIAGDTTQLSEGKASWEYELNAQALNAKLTIVDSTGKTVWEGAAPSLSKGKHAFEWNGKDSTGKALPSGAYTLKVAARDSADAVVASKTYVTGKVTSVEHGVDGTLLSVGGVKVPLSAITAVTA